MGRIIGAIVCLLVGCAYISGDVYANLMESSISGNVVQNRSGEGVMGATVEMTVYESGVFQYADQTTTRESGEFAFHEIRKDPQWSYVLEVEFDGGSYSVGPLSHIENEAMQLVSILVHETVSVDPGILIVQNAVIFREDSEGVLEAIHSVSLLNPSSKAFVANSKDAVLKFDVPEQSYNLRPLQGFSLSDVTELDGQFNIATTVPPGESGISYSYLFPWNPVGTKIEYKINMPTEELSFTCVEGRIDIESGDLVRIPSIVMSETASLARWGATSVPLGSAIEMRVFDPRVSILSRVLNFLTASVLGLISMLMGLAGALFAIRHVSQGDSSGVLVNTEALFDELMILEKDARNGNHSARLQANALRDRLIRLLVQRKSIS